MGYAVEVIHLRKCLIHGVVGTELTRIETKFFNTKKAAKEFIASDIKDRKCVKSEAHRYSDGSSFTVGWTDKIWFDEGTGDNMQEQFQYKLTK